MRYRHNAYTISGQTITLTGVTTVTPADVRLIIDETAMKVICSSMRKSNISCSGNVITVPSSVATLDASHDYTIELDFGEKAPTGYAQEATLGAYTDLSSAHTVFGHIAKLQEILDLVDDHVGSDTLTLNEKLDIIRTVIGEISLVQNSDNVGSGNQAWTLVLNQSLAVNNETIEQS